MAPRFKPIAHQIRSNHSLKNIYQRALANVLKLGEKNRISLFIGKNERRLPHAELLHLMRDCKERYGPKPGSTNINPAHLKYWTGTLKWLGSKKDKIEIKVEDMNKLRSFSRGES